MENPIFTGSLIFIGIWIGSAIVINKIAQDSVSEQRLKDAYRL